MSAYKFRYAVIGYRSLVAVPIQCAADSTQVITLISMLTRGEIEAPNFEARCISHPRKSSVQLTRDRCCLTTMDMRMGAPFIRGERGLEHCRFA